MRKLLNTLYVTAPDSYLSLDGENVVVLNEGKEVARCPLHNFESIVAFGYTGASPALMGNCAKRNIDLCFMTQFGRFLGRFIGEQYGNVVLRKEQYRVSESVEDSTKIARNFIFGKVYNAKWMIERLTRDYVLRLDVDKLKHISGNLSSALQDIRSANDLETLRGYEGEAANQYFSVFDDFILQQREAFYFDTRNKRAPLDRVNAMLSFAYTLLAKDVAAALETVGLDPYVGFMHRDRPGRISLALDVMEELRAIYADRFVLSLINRKEVKVKDFLEQENGAISMTSDARKQFLKSWQLRKKEEITHPFLKEKVEWGLVPYVQAKLLARYLRGDLDEYPPFLWK